MLEAAGLGARSAKFASQRVVLSRSGSAERIPALLLTPEKPSGVTTVFVTGHGVASLGPVEVGGRLRQRDLPWSDDFRTVVSLLADGHTVLAPDVFLTGEISGTNPAATPKIEFFAGYNRTVLANRVQDILTTIAAAKAMEGTRTVNLVGLGKAGPWCLLARALAGDAVARTACDGDQFDFDRVRAIADENYQPGMLRYGGLYAFAAAAAPAELLIYNGRAEQIGWLTDAYAASGAKDKLDIRPATDPSNVAAWIAR